MDNEQLDEMMRGITERLSRAERDINDLQLIPMPPTWGVYNPGTRPTSPSAYDDEFDATTLDPKWTNINCASGTVDMLAIAAAQDTYDLTMYQGMLALQPGQDDLAAGGPEAQAAIVRQTVVLAGTCKVLCKLNFAATVNAGGPVAGQSGIVLSGAGGFTDNNFLAVLLSSSGTLFTGNAVLGGAHNIGGAGLVSLAAATPATEIEYLMITKTVNDFSVWGGDGKNWVALTDQAGPDVTAFTFGAGVMVRLSLFCYFTTDVVNEPNIFNPIATFDFVRYITNNSPLTYA